MIFIDNEYKNALNVSNWEQTRLYYVAYDLNGEKALPATSLDQDNKHSDSLLNDDYFIYTNFNNNINLLFIYL